MCQGMYGLASTARHAFISARYKAIDKAHDRLTELIGHEETDQLVSRLVDSTLAMCLIAQELKDVK